MKKSPFIPKSCAVSGADKDWGGPLPPVGGWPGPGTMTDKRGIIDTKKEGPFGPPSNLDWIGRLLHQVVHADAAGFSLATGLDLGGPLNNGRIGEDFRPLIGAVIS